MKIRFSSSGLLLVLGITGLAVYAPVIHAPFIFDDSEFILNNPLARDFLILFNQRQAAGLKFLTFATFIGNFLIGGHHPVGYHVVNILLHVFNAWLLSVLSRKILLTPQIINTFDQKQRDVIPLIAALLFLVHPAATSAVSYIWQRAEVLTLSFYLSALIYYVMARQDRKISYFILSLVCFLFGILAKGTIVSLPLMILLFECAFWPVSRRKGKAIVFSLGGIFFLNMYLYLWEYPWNIYTHWIAQPLMMLTGTGFIAKYYWTQIYVIIRYWQLAFFPVAQNFDYDIAIAQSFGELRIVVSAIILVVIIALALRFWQKNRLLSVGIFWFVLCFLPTSYLTGREPMWEYRMYLSLAGILFGLTAFVIQKIVLRKAIPGLLVVAVVLGGLAFSRNLLWQSPELLLLDNIKKSPQKPNPYQLLGSIYLRQGRMEEAQKYLEKTIALAPDAAESYNNLGLIAKYRGDLEKAKSFFETAIGLRPSLTGAYINLAYLLLDQGEADKAEDVLRKSLLEKESEGAYAALGKVYLTRGLQDEAETYLQRSISMNPFAAPAYFWSGELYAARGQRQQAGKMYRKAIANNPRLKAKVPTEFRSE